jgi:phage terminase large subunit-like protein
MIGRTLSPTTKTKLSELFIQQYQEYCDMVLSGKRLVSGVERAKVRRHQARLKQTTGRWVFDMEKALKPLLWIAANYKFPLGEKRGKAFKAESWEIFDIMDLFGFVDRETGRRCYVRGYWQIPRKNGKSTLAGAIADYMAFGDNYPSAVSVIAANSLEQADDCFSRADEGLKLAKHKGYESYNSKTYKIIKWGECQVKALTAAPKDGKLIHCAILDEYHEAKDTGMLDSFLSGNVSDPESMALIITTAGTNIHGPCHQEYEKCKKIAYGDIENDRYWVGIYEAEKNDKPSERNTWIKANPNWGISIYPDMIEGRYKDSKDSASDLATFKTKNLNMWVYSLVKWANMEKWNDFCCSPVNIVEGAPCYGGIDLSSNSDFTAFVADFPPINGSSQHQQLYMFWVPEENVIKIQRQCSIPLEQWIQDGYVIATPGPVVDYVMVGQWLTEFREKYEVNLIAGDRHRLIDLARVTPSWFEEITFEFSQGKMTMSPSTQFFERQYLLGNIQSGGNPVMKWMMSSADSWTDSNGNVKLIKPKVDRSAARIDGVIAAIMAHDTAINNAKTGLTLDDLASAAVFF